MSDTLIEVFEKELKNKIALKLIPNQCEDQILIKYFKYFDLENSGLCNLRDFIRTIEKIGVVLGKINDIQEIFDYYDTEGSGVINYKKFSTDIFKRDEIKNANAKVKTFNKDMNEHSKKKKEVYFDKLHNILKPSGGKGLIQFCKEFKMVDYNNTNRLNIDDFIKIITETKIPLNINEIQLLFHSYELYNNNLFYYEEMFKDLKNIYHSDKREKFIDIFYEKCVEKLGRNLKLTDLKRFFNAKNHPLADGSSEDELTMEFYEIVDAFQFIKKLPRSDANITKENFIEFFKFFGFGIEQDETFMDLITSIFELRTGVENNGHSQGGMKKKGEYDEKMYYSHDIPKSSPNRSGKDISMNNINSNNQLLEKLKKSLKSFGRKSLFSLIKHFRYYDNGTKFINKYDFAKVIRDFRLNLPVNEIEKLFEAFCADKKQMLLNYEQFLFLLSEKSMNENRNYLIGGVYESLRNFSDTGVVDLELIKNFYNSKNHPLGKDEDEVFTEFVECIELFHFSYKNKKNQVITKDEFEEFYRIISFLVDEDEIFESVLRSEWKNVITGSNSNVRERETPQMVKREMTPVRNNFYPETEQRVPTPISTQNREKTASVRPATPLTKNMSEKEKEIALAQNQYSKPRTPVSEKIRYDAVDKLKQKLKRRGVRGLMNLHKQFLLNCTNLNAISYGDFVKVLKLQRIDFPKEDYDQIFEKFKVLPKNQPSYGGVTQFLNFSGFIRNFKKVLSNNRLQCVEKVFGQLDVDRTEMLFVEDIKLKFDGSKHPDVKKKLRSEDDITMEFLDCFELNYNFLATNDNSDSSNLVSFEEFANFYEYVSFLYDTDEEFISVLVSTWNLN